MEINSRPLNLNGINTNYGYYKSRNVRFMANPAPDRFEVTTLNNFTTEYNLKKAITENQKIKQILARHSISCDLNMETIRDLQEHHAKDTKISLSELLKIFRLHLKTKLIKMPLKELLFFMIREKHLFPRKY